MNISTESTDGEGQKRKRIVVSLEGTERLPDRSKSRLVTLRAIHEEIAPRFFYPMPSIYTLGRWLLRARLPKVKANHKAKRGGGLVYYHAGAVERWMSERSHE